MTSLQILAVVVVVLGMTCLGVWLRVRNTDRLEYSPEYLKAAELLAEHMRPKDISEPVHAIARAMQERPGTFRVEWLTSPAINKYTVGPKLVERYRVTDRVTGLSASVTEVLAGCAERRTIKLPFAITQDEQDFLLREGKRWIGDRKQRAADYRNAKRRKEWAAKYREAS